MQLQFNSKTSKMLEHSIKMCGLNLKGKTILTEAATGYYALTPFIAALAGADKVYALTRDSVHGKSVEIKKLISAIAKKLNLSPKIHILESREDPRISQADIITNLGFVRPINASFIKKLKKTAVIPLMFEPWEYRKEDLDLSACRSTGIPVVGTNESHPKLNILTQIGHLVCKLLFEVDVEIFHKRIAIIGGGAFGTATVKLLKAMKAHVFQTSPENGERLNSEMSMAFFSNCDAIVFVEHTSRKVLLGEKGAVKIKDLKQINPDVKLIHVAGNIEANKLKQAGFFVYPQRIASPGHMSVTLAYLGPQPLIDLHTAGLKVGEVMSQMTHRGLRGRKAEKATLRATRFAKLLP